jgi:hypothetical protein
LRQRRILAASGWALGGPGRAAIARLAPHVLHRWVDYIRSGGNVDQELKNLMKELGEAINQAVAESEQISDVMSRIKAGGHDVFLVLEATVGFNQHEGSVENPPPRKLKSSGKLEITSQDLKFLRSMRIAVNDER